MKERKKRRKKERYQPRAIGWIIHPKGLNEILALSARLYLEISSLPMQLVKMRPEASEGDF